MSGLSIMHAGNVLGYSDNNPLPTNSMDVVDVYNKMAINSPIYGHNEVLATLDRFRQNHSYEYTPINDFNADLNESSPLSLALDEMGKSANLVKRSMPEFTAQKSFSTPQTATPVNTEIDSDVAKVMSLLTDSMKLG